MFNLVTAIHIKILGFMLFKHFSFFCTCFIFTYCSAQNNFVLNGTVNGRDTGYIILRYTDYGGEWTVDTTYLKNGKFKFEGNISEPTLATIKGYRKIIDFNEVNVTDIYIEPGNQKIILTENDYAHAKVYGSVTQNELNTFNMQIDSINAKYKDVDQQLLKAKYAYKGAKTETDKKKALERETELMEQLNPRGNEVLNEDVDFVTKHPDSYASTYMIFTPINNLPIDSAKNLFNKLSLRVRESRDGKYIADMIRKKEQNRYGNLAYDFKATDAAGNNISLSKFLGKYVLLDFWASWCKPCRVAIPHLKEVYNQYHPKGLEILTISIDEDSVAWKKAISQEKINDWNNVLANKNINDNYDNTHQAIPTQILVGPDGKVAWTWQSEDTLDETLKKFLDR